MNPERLIKHFDRIAEAPDAIPRLRRFILDLAMRGKLVDQDSQDEPAFEIIKQIEKQKSHLTKGGVRRQAEAQSRKGKVPFSLPRSWEWVPIRKVTTDHGQKIPDKEFTYVDVSAINKERGKVTEPQVLTPDVAPSRARKIVHKGDVIYSCVRPYLLNIAVIDQDFDPEPIVSTAFAVLYGFDLVSPQYLWFALRSPFFVELVEEKMRGQAYPAINDRDFASLPIPLPPLAEQNRIVAKVDELMSLTDELEGAKSQREARRDRLVAATLNGLASGDANVEVGTQFIFEESARFYLNHLPQLTTRPEHIQQLRQTILNLAVRGKLVEQDPGDEPAGELLTRIDEENCGAGRISAVFQKLYEVPLMWQWSRLSELSSRIHYGYTGSSNPSSLKVRLLRITDIQNNGVNWVSVPGCEIADEQVEKYRLAKGDILIARTGGTIGKSFLVADVPFPAIFASYLIRIQASRQLFLPFIKLFFESPVYWMQLKNGTRGTGQPNVNAKTLGQMAVPIPPFAEQHRIVAKVEELMEVCDKLEAWISNIGTTGRQLLETTIYEALQARAPLEESWNSSNA